MASYSRYSGTSPKGEEQVVEKEILEYSQEIAERYKDLMEELGIEDFGEEMERRLQEGEYYEEDEVEELGEEVKEELISEKIDEELKEISQIVSNTSSILKDMEQLSQTLEVLDLMEGDIDIEEYLDMEVVEETLRNTEEMLKRKDNKRVSKYLSNIKKKLSLLNKNRQSQVSNQLDTQLGEIFNIVTDTKNILEDTKKLSTLKEEEKIDYDIRKIKNRLNQKLRSERNVEIDSPSIEPNELEEPTSKKTKKSDRDDFSHAKRVKEIVGKELGVPMSMEEKIKRRKEQLLKEAEEKFGL